MHKIAPRNYSLAGEFRSTTPDGDDTVARFVPIVTSPLHIQSKRSSRPALERGERDDSIMKMCTPIHAAPVREALRLIRGLDLSKTSNRVNTRQECHCLHEACILAEPNESNFGYSVCRDISVNDTDEFRDLLMFERRTINRHMRRLVQPNLFQSPLNFLELVLHREPMVSIPSMWLTL